MPYGAHEMMETHEILMEKINCITHFNLYAQEAKHPQLLDMIVRHQQEEIASYNEIIAQTRGSNRFTPIPPNTNIHGLNRQQINYGLNNPPQFAPQADAVLTDAEIAIAMLLCHKNSARNCSWAALECADPNLRRTMQNGAATCTNQAYEVFLFMNEQGLYQVPTLQEQTEQSFLRSYQPAPGDLVAQYDLQPGMQGSMQMGMPNNGGFNMQAGSRESVLYGDGRGQAAYSQYQGSMQQ